MTHRSKNWRRALRSERQRLVNRLTQIDVLLSAPRRVRTLTLSDKITRYAQGMTSNEVAALVNTSRKYVDRVLRMRGWKLSSNGASNGRGKAIERFWQPPSNE